LHCGNITVVVLIIFVIVYRFLEAIWLCDINLFCVSINNNNSQFCYNCQEKDGDDDDDDNKNVLVTTT